MKKNLIKFIHNAGGCIVSKNILSGKGKVKWIVRKESIDPVDNGWRFFSDIDDDDYGSDANNFCVCDFNTVANIEPAVLRIYLHPVGSDLVLVNNEGEIEFYDYLTGEEVRTSYPIAYLDFEEIMQQNT